MERASSKELASLGALAFLLVLGATPAVAGAGQSVKAYDPRKSDQYQPARTADLIPVDASARRLWARAIAFDAAIYGTAAVLEYRQLYAQAVDRGSSDFTGFNRFAHGRDLAGPDYRPFKSPNADTLYSHAWLDLRNGPVLLEVPDTAGRYFTASFLDIHGNASNISARTHGTKGGRFLVATTAWRGAVPAGANLFRVNTPFTWVLLRMLVDRPSDLPKARAMQDRFTLRATASEAPTGGFPDGTDESAVGFFRILDFVLRECGHPAGEEALVHRYAGLGIGGGRMLDTALADPDIRGGMETGLAEAQQVIAGATRANGNGSGGWSTAVDLGRYGMNYLYRAVINTLGTGANVVDENHPFTTFVDSEGAALDGTNGSYRLDLAPPPPARFFWSLTVYERESRTLFANPWRKYVIGDRTPGLVRGADDHVSVVFSTRPPASGPKANWLPIPAKPFYVAVRAQGPAPAVSDGSWRPPAITRYASVGDQP